MPDKSSNLDAKIDRVARECIAVRMRLLNRVITNIYDTALRPLGVKVSQLNVLVAAAKLQLARPQDVCRILQLDSSTLSRNLERMKSRGWIQIVPGADARTQSFRLTSAGRRLLERALPAWERAQGRACELLGENGLGGLSAAAGSFNT
ncbi:MAG TPA: MarR family winged helix-turn-helix transcriptional regulator [Tepidisphaeraceae bacterium]|jgi:DNA-binding MarR family transcriptional regulator|nr:MarR family winged helix-turn-helix transcriptional regulator [Tepidisphaeraceae bacterium]